ncbi:RadC family protein [Mitsuokella sp. oral taxon 131]|uniref:RadC family protein n=1 Tax=Mitsuokella sp. oral taxon 131 TaxID=1321780 RepID=UPI0003AE065E|nr:DNA repair protein RadC [Mitsuokella sp. oral taxon 131]ERL03340.1 putative DNA repair protein RadC [Mitsuokella sp. oral taxon 131 str. W9106]
MTIMVRDLPREELPREKLIEHGAAALSNAELLAVLLRTGTQSCSVLTLSQEVLARLHEQGIAALSSMAPGELTDIKGLGAAKAATVLAAVELGKRLSACAAVRVTVRAPEDAAHYAMPRLFGEQREHFAVLLLDAKHRILGMRNISIGSLTASVVHPREVFQAALRGSAAALILVHNHPSGDPTPSHEDAATTERLVKAGKVMGIPVLDHIVLGRQDFFSMKEHGMMR